VDAETVDHGPERDAVFSTAHLPPPTSHIFSDISMVLVCLTYYSWRSPDDDLPLHEKIARKASNEGLTGGGGLGFAVTKQMESLINHFAREKQRLLSYYFAVHCLYL